MQESSKTSAQSNEYVRNILMFFQSIAAFSLLFLLLSLSLSLLPFILFPFLPLSTRRYNLKLLTEKETNFMLLKFLKEFIWPKNKPPIHQSSNVIKGTCIGISIKLSSNLMAKFVLLKFFKPNCLKIIDNKISCLILFLKLIGKHFKKEITKCE